MAGQGQVYEVDMMGIAVRYAHLIVHWAAGGGGEEVEIRPSTHLLEGN